MNDPHSGAEIAAALRALHAESVSYWGAFSTPEFFAPIGSAWSPSDNVRHLTKSVRAVSKGLALPRLLLLLGFRSGRRASRTYSEVRDVYRARLAQGADAGRFSPSRRTASESPEQDRATIMAHHAVAIDDMTSLIARWSESALDRRQLPHPLLRPLTVREMLFFTLYHNQHHMDVVRRRLAEAERGVSAARE